MEKTNMLQRCINQFRSPKSMILSLEDIYKNEDKFNNISIKNKLRLAITVRNSYLGKTYYGS